MPQTPNFLNELLSFAEPLTQLLDSEESCTLFFRQFGYDVASADIASLFNTLTNITPSLTDTFGDIFDGDISQMDVVIVARELFSAIQRLVDNDDVRVIVTDSTDFMLEVFDYLVARYLSSRIPVASGLLKALGVIETKEIESSRPGSSPASADVRQYAFTQITLRWDRLGTFVKETGEWAYDVYGWAGKPSSGDEKYFDYEKAINNLVGLVESTKTVLAYEQDLTPAELSVFLKNTDPTVVTPQAVLPLFQDEFDSDGVDGEPIFANEVGIKVIPSGDLNIPERLGLAVSPYAKGHASAEKDITENLSFSASFTGSATGGAYLNLSPEGIDMLTGGTVNASFEYGLKYAKQDNEPIIFVGDADSTRIQANAIVASVGGHLTGDFYIAGGVEGLSATVDLSSDGFLGAIISEPIDITLGSVLMGWRNGRGVYFDGGTRLSVTVPLDLDLGPVSIYEVSLALDWESDVDVTLAITADATLGPLYAYAENMGVVISVEKNQQNTGLLGQYDLDFGFQPPTGYAVALDFSPVGGGGFLSIDEHEYRGALALEFESFGFSAFGILNTQLPNGRDGFSMAASIFGEFSLPLGYGFFLTGVGGVIGINRTCNTDALRDVLYEGRLDNLLFPSNPIANAKTILDDMAEILPAKEGQHLAGPVMKIAWGQPVLVDVKLGLILEVGDEVRLVILGGLGCNLPTKESALVALNLSFMGEIDFAAGTLSFDATLQGSRILTFAVSGDAAIRTGWANRIEHLASFGGFHPEYPIPPGLPNLRRLSINFGTNNPKITLSAYQAVTLNSLQFGARADLYAKGPKVWLVGRLAAEGEIYFDALIYFNPFAFDTRLGGGLRLLVDGDTVCGLGFSIRFTGPNTFKIDGKVWVTVFGIDVDFNVKHTWGARQTLPEATVNAITALRSALLESKGFETVAPSGRSSGVSFRSSDESSSAVDPVGGLRFMQRALPLGVSIQKIGDATVVGPNKLDLKVFSQGREVNVSEIKQDFVRGHFFSLTEDEKLRSAAFEKYKAGFELKADELVTKTGAEITAEYEYEVIEIPVEDERDDVLKITPHFNLDDALITRFMRGHQELHFRSRGSIIGQIKPEDIIVVEETSFVRQKQFSELATQSVGRVDNSLIDRTLRQADFSHTNLSQAFWVSDDAIQLEANPVVADYIAAAQLRN
ncbi:DUF6603 domain-containing protein [Alkalimarinus alittae]|uniref:DUF6603 domain-containing protein n=1 Tax=Alkalimarinus alittae TaxID=2961619 RepID=A0ABY6N630_9ALTE|nr:DUF6603 domain-containing protein [Alkalimarinus alittae]UZE97470.1 hypothetical protein NKI27_06925 [Alkalimarinus alittae]